MKRGFTLMETVMYVVLTGIIGIGATSLIAGNIISFETTTNQIDADQSASTSLGIMSRNLQEAKQFTINTPTSLTVFYPIKNGNGTYDRTDVDNVNTITFYRGNTNGVASDTGSCLIRSTAAGAKWILCRCVTNLNFTAISDSSVDVTLQTAATAFNKTRSCMMIHRAIFLRNY